MVFFRENCKPIHRVTRKLLEQSLRRMKSYGPSSYAWLEATDGSYIQVAGGPYLYLVEYHSAEGLHYRGHQDDAVVPFPDGTLLVFTGGRIALKQLEWFTAPQVLELLMAFSNSPCMPQKYHWSKLDSSFQHSD
jgi:hypothetical protein